MKYISYIKLDSDDDNIIVTCTRETTEDVFYEDEAIKKMAKPGDVFQIVKANEDRSGWLGALVMATKIASWGIQCFVHVIDTHESSGRAYVRLKWDEIAWIGPAPMVPED